MNYDFLRGANNQDCPCAECPDREIGCHGKCEKYKAWREKLNEIRAEDYKRREGYKTVSDTAVRQMWRKLRWQNNQTRRRSDRER